MKPVACFLVLVLTVPALAQHRETQTVEVVEVPVYVTGASGSVTGLTRDNFELLINGKPQTIDYFDVVDFGALAAEPPSTARRDMRERRLYMLLFDMVFSTPNSIIRAQKAAEQFLAKSGETDEFAVAAFSPLNGLEIIAPFSRDRLTTMRAVRSLRPTAMADRLRLGMASEEIAQLQQAMAQTRAGDTPDPEACAPGSVCGELFLERARGPILHQIQEIAKLAPRLEALEGQRHVVLLSNGFPSQPVTGVEPRPALVDPTRTGQPDSTAKMVLRGGAPQTDSYSMKLLQKLHAAFGAAGVFLDAIDTAGMRAGASFEDEEGLVMMARETGGQIIANDNDLGHALQVLADRQRVVYVLGFHARNTGRKENVITVRLRGVEGNPDFNYRHTYPGVIETPKHIDAIRLADILTNDIPQHGIETLLDAADGKVDVRIPLRPLLAQFDKHADLDVLMYVFAGDRAVAVKEKRIGIEHDRAAAAGANAAIHFAQQFDLLPGQYVAKVVVAMDENGSAGFARQDFTIP